MFRFQIALDGLYLFDPFILIPTEEMHQFRLGVWKRILSKWIYGYLKVVLTERQLGELERTLNARAQLCAKLCGLRGLTDSIFDTSSQKMKGADRWGVILKVKRAA